MPCSLLDPTPSALRFPSCNTAASNNVSLSRGPDLTDRGVSEHCLSLVSLDLGCCLAFLPPFLLCRASPSVSPRHPVVVTLGFEYIDIDLAKSGGPLLQCFLIGGEHPYLRPCSSVTPRNRSDPASRVQTHVCPFL